MQDRAEDRDLGLVVLRRHAAVPAGATRHWPSAVASGQRRQPVASYSAVTMVLTSAVTPSDTSTVTMCVPVVLIGSLSWTLRLSSLTPARLPHRVDDLLRGDRAEQPAVVARLVRDREHGLAQQRRVLLGALGLLGAPPARPPPRAAWPRRARPPWPAEPACAARGSCAGSRRRRPRRRRAPRAAPPAGAGSPEPSAARILATSARIRAARVLEGAACGGHPRRARWRLQSPVGSRSRLLERDVVVRRRPLRHRPARSGSRRCRPGRRSAA